MSSHLDKLSNWYKKNFTHIREEFIQFLRFPSVSTDPVYKEGVRNCAEWLRNLVAKLGFQSELIETEGHPILFAHYRSEKKNAPTLLIYHHYDVQPPDPLALWKSGPFEPRIEGDRIYARGASDNKGQCFYTLMALRAYLELFKGIDLNVKLFIEGEEESGGKGTKGALPKMGERLRADYLIVVDSGLPNASTPAITIGVRGIVAFEVTVKNAGADLHSGSHGGLALNPNRMLVQALAQLWTKEGRIAVPGFYSDVLEMSHEEQRSYYSDFDPIDYQKKFGVKVLAPEPGYSPEASKQIRPTIEINGLQGGYTQEGFKTVIPATAFAKISCRLVPNQDPEKIVTDVEAFIRKTLPKDAAIDFKFYDRARAFRTSGESLLARRVSGAYEEVFHTPCQRVLMGGSIPIVIDLARLTGAETLLMGVALDQDAIHSPNEHFDFDRLEKGFLTMGIILKKLGE